MMKKLVVTASLAACAIAASPAFAGGDCAATGVDSGNLSNIDPYYYNATFDGAGNNLTLPDSNATTDSGIPHLPQYYGAMSTNNTYRFFNVNEMVATMIGEGKHGLWRVQDNGTVREYLIASQAGLAPGDDMSTAASVANYTHLDAAASWNGYRSDAYAPAHPGEIIDQLTGVTDAGTPGNTSDDYRVWVDLPINHAKYDAKADGGYDSHVPIDLPHWYCTMSGPEYKEARAAVRFAFAQDGANQVGPLGKRAGLDIKENYLNVLRMEQFPDAQAWVNTSGSVDVVNYEPIATNSKKMKPYEIYLVERPFFNEEYLFITVVFADRGNKSKNFSYIRPDGAYYDHLMARKASGEKLPKFRTKLRHAPRFPIGKDAVGNKRSGKGRQAATPTNLYGVHHPATGACPAIGGDFGASYYGGSWPTTYQEVTPLCDAVMLDIKLWANLNGATWNDKGAYLANATVGGNQNSGDLDGDANALTRGHTDTAGVYGAFADPYLTNKGAVNPEQFTATGTQSKTYQSARPAVSGNAALAFTPSL